MDLGIQPLDVQNLTESKAFEIHIISLWIDRAHHVSCMDTSVPNPHDLARSLPSLTATYCTAALQTEVTNGSQTKFLQAKSPGQLPIIKDFNADRLAVSGGYELCGTRKRLGDELLHDLGATAHGTVMFPTASEN
jgi:hypothetical protein